MEVREWEQHILVCLATGSVYILDNDSFLEPAAVLTLGISESFFVWTSEPRSACLWDLRKLSSNPGVFEYGDLVNWNLPFPLKRHGKLSLRANKFAADSDHCSSRSKVTRFRKHVNLLTGRLQDLVKERSPALIFDRAKEEEQEQESEEIICWNGLKPEKDASWLVINQRSPNNVVCKIWNSITCTAISLCFTETWQTVRNGLGKTHLHV